MEITLTEKQIQIISGIQQSKQALEQEYQRLIQRETEFIVNLCEAKGVEAIQGIEFKENKMIVPDKKQEEQPKKPKK